MPLYLADTRSPRWGPRSTRSTSRLTTRPTRSSATRHGRAQMTCLGYAPYVLHGVKYIDPVSLDASPFFRTGQIEMCFDIGPQHLWRRGQNTSRIQNEEVYATVYLHYRLEQRKERRPGQEQTDDSVQVRNPVPCSSVVW